MKIKIDSKAALIQLAIGLFLATIWEIAGSSSEKIFFILGTPLSILKEFSQLLFHESLHVHFITTGKEAIFGLAIGTSLGSLFGLSLWYSEKVAKISKPFIIALGTLPVFAFAPLMIVWFGVGIQMKIALAAFSTVFVAFNQAYRGATSVSSEMVETLKGLNATRTQIFFKVIIPGSINWVLSSMRLNVGFSLLGAFIGEFIASEKGLGHIILKAAGLYNVPRAFGAAIGIVILALTLEGLASIVEQRSHYLVQLISVPRKIRNATVNKYYRSKLSKQSSRSIKKY